MNISHTAIRVAFSLLGLGVSSGQAQNTTVTVQAGTPGKPISPDLVGIFFEDLSYAADGGLYAELIQNRSFEYSRADRPEWNALTSWELVQATGSNAELITASESPLHPDNPHHAILRIPDGSSGAGLKNSGFDGIPVKAGESHVFSVFARQLARPGGPMTVRLEGESGSLLAEATLPKPGADWKKSTVVLKADSTDADAYLTINYHVQQLFSGNSGDLYLSTTLSDSTNLAASTVRDAKTGDLILKLVNGANVAKPVRIEIAGANGLVAEAQKTVLAGLHANDANEDGKPPAAEPKTSPISVGPAFVCDAPANSLTIVRIATREK